MTTRTETTTPAKQVDRRAVRRQQTKVEIVAAAWDLVRENGLTGLAMRELGERVGMKAQSIYSYFESKNEIFDAMFYEGNLAFAAAMESAVDETNTDARVRAQRAVHRFFEFCTSDPVRYQLLFQRTIPGFVPSEESYTVAQSIHQSMADQLAAVGVEDTAAVDMWTAVATGLASQQISNDPGGDRWELLIDRAVDMLFQETMNDRKPTERKANAHND